MVSLTASRAGPREERVDVTIKKLAEEASEGGEGCDAMGWMEATLFEVSTRPESRQ